jgi:hypothetical protein
MLTKHQIAGFTLGMVLVAAGQVSAQVDPGAEGGPNPEEGTQMLMPPPVSGVLYPSVGTVEARLNYVAPSLKVNAGYLDNVLPGLNAPPVGDATYSFAPSISLDRTTPQQQMSAEYDPTFTFYEPTSSLDAIDQSASATYQYHSSPYLAISIGDFFSRTSNVFDVNYPFAQGGLTGGVQGPGAAAIAPFAEQLNNTANGGFAYQFGRNAMVGAGGSFSNFQLLDAADALGLDNSHGGGASAFYDRRIAALQYAGISYEYDRTLAGPSKTEVDAKVQSFLPFYTIYLNRTFSFSLSGGAQYVGVAQPAKPTSNSWQPVGVFSMGWQANRGSVSASYLHTVTSGRGLAGAYNSDSVNGLGTWGFTHKWMARAEASYTTLNTVVQLADLPYQGGDTFAIRGSLAHDFNEHFNVEGGYERLHQSYTGIAVIFKNPDSDREFVTVSYHFDKPLGR